MYKITLADGQILDNLRKDGTVYVSNQEVTESMFLNNMSTVTIETPDGVEKHGAMTLGTINKYIGHWTFTIYDLTPEELYKIELEHQNKMLNEQINALNGQNQFLEDCIAEMAGVVYA